MRSLSDDIRILLKCFGWEGEPSHGPGYVVFEEISLVGFEKQAFDDVRF